MCIVKLKQLRRGLQTRNRLTLAIWILPPALAERRTAVRYGEKASAFWMLCPWPFLRQMQSGVAARDAAFAVAVCLSLRLCTLPEHVCAICHSDVQYCTRVATWLSCVLAVYGGADPCSNLLAPVPW